MTDWHFVPSAWRGRVRSHDEVLKKESSLSFKGEKKQKDYMVVLFCGGSFSFASSTADDDKDSEGSILLIVFTMLIE